MAGSGAAGELLLLHRRRDLAQGQTLCSRGSASCRPDSGTGVEGRPNLTRRRHKPMRRCGIRGYHGDEPVPSGKVGS
jgi:hypothetical protein